MYRNLVLTLSLVFTIEPALAQRGDGKSEERWNVTGPASYETPCGHAGLALTYGLPYANWRKPCSVPIRVCEYKTLTFSYPAEPDVPCEKMATPAAAGELQRTYLKRWD